MRTLSLLALAACSGPDTPASTSAAPPTEPTTTSAPTTTNDTPSNIAPNGARLAPVIHAPPVANRACNLRWNEVGAPDRIELTKTLADECVPFEDPDAPVPNVTTVSATMHGGVHAELTIDGPNGSGRFLALGLTIGAGRRQRYACATGSTVGWRYMHPVAQQLAPLPFLSDVDRDGSAELVVWNRLPWGDSELDNALFPVVYVLDGDALIRRDDRAKELFARVAAAYRARAQTPEKFDPTACFLAVAQFLES